MTDRAQIARDAAAGLRRFASQISQTPVMVGFDGFVDSIIEVVDQRFDSERYTPIATIEQFGRKILNAAGQSSNYELMTKLTKLGGNGPIMANALAAQGFAVTYVGALGHPGLHPVFEELARRASVLSFADPGFTDAIEFSDGKLMLGKHATLKDINIDELIRVVGADQFYAVVAQSRMLAMVNWTMLTKMESIWRYIIDRVLPKVAGASDSRKLVFIDLADPEKRTREDLKNVLSLVARFGEHADVTLGLNLKESTQVAQALGIDPGVDPEEAMESTAVAIRQKLDLTTVVIHPRRGAAGATRTADGVRSASFAGPFIREPRLSTGAGDNFNAGFVLGQLAGLPIEQCLCTAVGASGYYVRHAGSCSLDQLAAFCDDLPAPQG